MILCLPAQQRSSPLSSSQPSSPLSLSLPLSPAVPRRRRRICKTWLEVLIKGSKTPPSSFPTTESGAVDRPTEIGMRSNDPTVTPPSPLGQVVFWFGLRVCSVARISGERLGATEVQEGPRQGHAEQVSKSRNKFHQTWSSPLSESL